MSRTRHDPGLHAVARVRGVREQDSRLGLQQALRELRQREADLAALEASLREHGARVEGDLGSFAALRLSLLGLRERMVEARAQVAAAEGVARDAHARWSSDKARLGAVEGLLERRAEERRVEAGRAEATELDDVAGRLWLRAAQEATA
ncbi:flagellar FliJ family protein [Nocardioides sp. TRM66260-LWL]|uniref:flagellar FliJ family protein n=1 Tax=Nocardioides sp. TRM66260-LWL TaxID=2874478 RepID=UPI001CC3F63F|nr:flagellar FliJ family protein [Nocardioides sp. TRM66260-LWL]MBZ5735183.1 flagellar FliJ family protein [Nocardioides sp. TRM66260-LWL]